MAPSSQYIDKVMESKNQFRLTNAIKDWRGQFQSEGTIDGRDLDELECHLRDTLDELIELGLAEEEAFLVAQQRIGSPRSLGSEFGKLNPSRLWNHRICWMLVGYISFYLVGDLASVLSRMGALGASMIGLGPVWMNSICVGLLIVPWLAFLHYLWRHCHGEQRAQTPLISRLLKGKAALSVFIVVATFAALLVLDQASTVMFHRTQIPIDAAVFSNYHLTQVIARWGLTCCLLAGGTLTVFRLRRQLS